MSQNSDNTLCHTPQQSSLLLSLPVVAASVVLPDVIDLEVVPVDVTGQFLALLICQSCGELHLY